VLGEPGDSTPISKEGVAGDGMPVLGHAAVGVCIALKGLQGFSIQQPEVAHACQVVEDLLDSFPVCRPGV